MGGRRAVERRCRELIAQLDIPDPFDVRELCRRLGAARGRAILLAELPISAAGFCGLWLAGADADYVFYEQNTSASHQEHIILHELGHILFEHGGSGGLAQLFPGLDERTVRIMLARRHEAYSDLKETEAETFAYLVQGHVDGRARPAGEEGPAGRIRRVLEG